MSDWTEQFADAIHQAVGARPEQIIPNAGIQRFSTGDKPKRGERNGYYVAYDDGDRQDGTRAAAGAAGCWRAGVHITWHTEATEKQTAEERRGERERLERAKADRLAEQEARNNTAAERAASIWAAGEECASHPYLDRKGVSSHGLKVGRWELVDEETGEIRVISDRALLVPLRDGEKRLRSLQAIFPGAILGGRDKDYLKDGAKAGCFFSIGKPKTSGGRAVVLIAEGYATGASLHECTGHAVAVAFDSGNLGAVAAVLRSKFPDAELVICADNDQWTIRPVENPGLAKAREAAKAVGAWVAIPPFRHEEGITGPDGKTKGPTDWNDYHQQQGAEAVRECIEAAMAEENDPKEGWPEPTPLPTALPRVERFSEDLLPDALRAWGMDIAERMQCPADFVAVGALVALSILVGARVLVSPLANDDWQVTPNLWGAVIAPPGAMKSPALAEVMKPLHKMEGKLRESWQQAHSDWQVDTKARELRQAANEKDAAQKIRESRASDVSRLLKPEPELPEPTMRRLIVNDSTVEALGEVLRGNSGGLLAYRDEIYGLLKSMDREGQEGARTFYLTAFDGNAPYTFDRIGRGLNIRIERVCLAMLGGIQPGRIAEYVRQATTGGGGDDGLVQRFQLSVWPDIAKDWKNIDRKPNMLHREQAYAVFERLALIPDPVDDAAVWRFDPAAQAAFNEWRTTYLEPRVRSDELHPAMASHLAKYRKLVPALALLFALIDHPESAGLIPEDCMLRALAWSEYLESHATRIYSAAVTPEMSGAVILLRKLKAGELPQVFTARDIYRKGWGGLNTPEGARKAALVLADFDWLRRDNIQTSGRPAEVFYVNPRLSEAA